jgi:hypothetical protein
MSFLRPGDAVICLSGTTPPSPLCLVLLTVCLWELVAIPSGPKYFLLQQQAKEDQSPSPRHVMRLSSILLRAAKSTRPGRDCHGRFTAGAGFAVRTRQAGRIS